MNPVNSLRHTALPTPFTQGSRPSHRITSRLKLQTEPPQQRTPAVLTVSFSPQSEDSIYEVPPDTKEASNQYEKIYEKIIARPPLLDVVYYARILEMKILHEDVPSGWKRLFSKKKKCLTKELLNKKYEENGPMVLTAALTSLQISVAGFQISSLTNSVLNQLDAACSRATNQLAKEANQQMLYALNSACHTIKEQGIDTTRAPKTKSQCTRFSPCLRQFLTNLRVPRPESPSFSLNEICSILVTTASITEDPQLFLMLNGIKSPFAPGPFFLAYALLLLYPTVNLFSLSSLPEALCPLSISDQKDLMQKCSLSPLFQITLNTTSTCDKKHFSKRAQRSASLRY